MKRLDLNNLSKLLGRSPYYRKQNLGLVLNKDGFNLDYWINKLISQEILIPLKKGVYASSFFIDEMREKGLFDSYLRNLANTLREPSYISLEYALSYYGLIPEEVFVLTSITLKSTRTYRSKIISFIYRNIKEDLFIGFENKSGVKIATLAKALFDFLYLKKFKNEEDLKDFLLETGRINWMMFKKLDRKEFASYVRSSKSKKMKLILKIINSVK